MIVASLGLVAGVTIQLGLVDPFTIVLVVLAVIFLFRFKINPTWPILAGSLAGALVKLFGM